jgi:hypothetical protein
MRKAKKAQTEADSGKPSKWLRDGCHFAPVQCFWTIIVPPTRPAASALGAMLLGELGTAGWDWMMRVGNRAGAYEESASIKALSAKTIYDCPAVADCPEWVRKRKKPREYRADSLVMHLNDYHYWRREQIAAWLESIGL